MPGGWLSWYFGPGGWLGAPGKSVGVVTLDIVSFLAASAHTGWTKLQTWPGGEKKLPREVPVASNSESPWESPKL